MPTKEERKSSFMTNRMSTVDTKKVIPVCSSSVLKNSTTVNTKIVLVGDCECGKTALIRRYMQSNFTETYKPTGFDTYSGSYNVSDTYTINMSIWDTSGDAGYSRVRPLSYTDADLIIFCFSISQPQSMENVVSKWQAEVREHCPKQPIMLVGCKADLRLEANNITPVDSDRTGFVTHDQAIKAAKHIGALVYSETSSKISQRSVDDVMEVAALSSAGVNRTVTDTVPSASVSNDNTALNRQYSFIRHKRFSGLTDARTHLRKEAAKSCAVM